MKIIIYATHSFGTYETLKQHPDIVILGFGTKWVNFIEKGKVIQEYLNTLPQDEIVVIIDGFDSYIKKTEGLQEEFIKMKCKVLVSLDDGYGGVLDILPKKIKEYLLNKVFPKCQNNYTVNSGLMMGYVKYLNIVYDKVINGPSKDDQRNLNLACKELPFIKIDINDKIFQNCANIKEVNISKSYFCQIPASLSISRLFRGIKEYSEYFIPEIIGLSLLLISIIYLTLPKKRKRVKRF